MKRCIFTGLPLHIMQSVHKHMDGMWDFAFASQGISDTTGKLMMFDDGYMSGVFLRFLVCSEVSTVFITHVYGTIALSLVTDVADIPPWVWLHIMPQLFPDAAEVRPFSHADFEAACRTIMHGCLPSWMLYTHDEELLQRECPTIQDTHHKYITDHFDILPARDASKNDSIAYR